MKDIQEDCASKLKLKNEELTDMAEEMKRALATLRADDAKDKSDALDKQSQDYEDQLFKVKEEAMAAQEVAIAAIVQEKVKFEKKLKEAEEAMAKILSKESRAEDY